MCSNTKYDKANSIFYHNEVYKSVNCVLIAQNSSTVAHGHGNSGLACWLVVDCWLGQLGQYKAL